MPEVEAARAAYEQAQLDAIELRRRARVLLGRASLQERTKLGKKQQAVATESKVVVEQVRRWEAEWREWERQHPGEEPYLPTGFLTP